jgi:hypothetical protein
MTSKLNSRGMELHSSLAIDGDPSRGAVQSPYSQVMETAGDP